MLLYSMRNFTGRWEIERWNGDGLMRAAEPLMRGILGRAQQLPLYYDPLVPRPDQRNRVVDARSWIDTHAPGTWEHSPMCVEILEPLGLHESRQPRALLCDERSVVGWFGALTPAPLTRRQHRLLSALVEPMRQRLIAERRLQDSPAVSAALDVMLDRLGSPAFLIDAHGVVREANEAGRSLADDHQADVAVALRDAIAHRPNAMSFELIEISARGLPVHWLAVQRVDPLERRIVTCVQACAKRWQLTPRQTEVLDLLARGLANATIASSLGCVERTVELHITAIFDRAGLDSRSALVSTVLTTCV
ncbi:MAG: LuxR C-terminal-related transcriptional regulator [Myxococcota bacterium]|nr:LuxR C-terminal-related transcriptional regulator [Myxococcota bacterium]